jgi:hypothetical protein
MYILEVNQQLELDTPRGRGRLLYVTEYGMEIEKLFTVVLNDNGQIWEFTNRDIRCVNNITFGRKIPRENKIGVKNVTLNQETTVSNQDDRIWNDKEQKKAAV